MDVSGGVLSTLTSLSAGSLQLSGGEIDQPNSTSDITVTGNFNWTGGTLNNTSNLANVNIDGASATIAPANGGTVTLGSNINLDNEAAGTIANGEIDPNKAGIQLGTNTGSSLLMSSRGAGGILLGVHSQFTLQGVIAQGTTWTVDDDTLLTINGEVGNEGTYILSSGALVQISGPKNGDVAYTQFGATSATYLHGDSQLETPNKTIDIANGILATVYDSSVGTGDATISAQTLEVDAGDIYINYQGANSQFGELLVDGNVWWRGGTFHTKVFSDGVTADDWRTTNASGYGGRFEIDAGTVAPIYVDSDYGTSSLPTSGASWKVLQAGGGFVNNTAPSVTDTTIWSLQIDTGNPSIFWKLVAN